MSQTSYPAIAVPMVLLRATGLSSWPERGSEYAPLVVAQWHYETGGLAVELDYSQQEGLWVVRAYESNGDYVGADLVADAQSAWTRAVGLAAAVSGTTLTSCGPDAQDGQS